MRACCAGALVFLAACGAEKADSANALAAAGDDPAARAAAVLSSPVRPEADHADDKLRKPANVLAFIDTKPGMKVFEIEAGAGYYTELLSPLAGPTGEVVMHNPESFDAFLGDAVPNRVNGRLNNVRISKSNFETLDAEDASQDLVTWILGPHDIYYTANGAAPVGDDAAAFAEIMRILKPGATFIVLDHAATAGSPKSSGDTLHRIDPAIVMELAHNAGFVFAGESDVLRHPDDNFNSNVFDPTVRRMTDRFLYKFTKPE
ncbi:MAG: methyltransferase [Hyphococcus sp.]|nr:MAG: methyltransferase [Marinicaulis sp.]